ncbi:MAG: UDP-GlcNAc:UDP-phosphate GlcNAc-phosphate transferase [Sphingobacteriales bacterium]|nr:UDP-GlcNAc:UDP-phosphate GlcNAc-phosphate transferase [Sphingobacteriales bacterium]
MPDYILYIIFCLLMFGLELTYFRIAEHFNIIDHPNERSSHTLVTLRGGGIIFPMALLLYFSYSDLQYPFFMGSLLLISTISFLDDINSISNRLRLAVQIIAVGIMFYHFKLWDQHVGLLVGSYIIVIGAINAYNFMDGINGITGLYSLSIIISLLYLNKSINFIDNLFLIVVILSIIVFLFFNFRSQARCFAGDVGSVSMAFIILFVIISLILNTHEYLYVLFLAVYGIDSGLTMISRLLKKENIFEPHRQHAYQLLSNELGFSHLLITSLYAGFQLLINALIIYLVSLGASAVVEVTFVIVVLILLSAIYIYIIKRSGFSQKSFE